MLSDPKVHREFVESLGSRWFNICVDVGHSNITGYNPVEVIRAMDKDILKAIHIHDNVHRNMGIMPATLKYTEIIGRNLVAKFENR